MVGFAIFVVTKQQIKMKKVSVIIDGGEYAISYERKGEQEVEFKVYVSDPALLAKTGAMFTFAVSVNEDKGFFWRKRRGHP